MQVGSNQDVEPAAALFLPLDGFGIGAGMVWWVNGLGNVGFHILRSARLFERLGRRGDGLDRRWSGWRNDSHSFKLRLLTEIDKGRHSGGSAIDDGKVGRTGGNPRFPEVPETIKAALRHFSHGLSLFNHDPIRSCIRRV